jgi:taurine dioxygenase
MTSHWKSWPRAATRLCDLYAAFEHLPPELRQRTLRLRAKHDGTYNSGGYVRRGITPRQAVPTGPSLLSFTVP